MHQITSSRQSVVDRFGLGSGTSVKTPCLRPSFPLPAASVACRLLHDSQIRNPDQKRKTMYTQGLFQLVYTMSRASIRQEMVKNLVNSRLEG